MLRLEEACEVPSDSPEDKQSMNPHAWLSWHPSSGRKMMTCAVSRCVSFCPGQPPLARATGWERQTIEEGITGETLKHNCQPNERWVRPRWGIMEQKYNSWETSVEDSPLDVRCKGHRGLPKTIFSLINASKKHGHRSSARLCRMLGCPQYYDPQSNGMIWPMRAANG